MVDCPPSPSHCRFWRAELAGTGNLSWPSQTHRAPDQDLRSIRKLPIIGGLHGCPSRATPIGTYLVQISCIIHFCPILQLRCDPDYSSPDGVGLFSNVHDAAGNSSPDMSLCTSMAGATPIASMADTAITSYCVSDLPVARFSV